MDSQFDLVQAFADAWTEGALSTARLMEASTKSSMAGAKSGPPKSSKSGWYKHPDQSEPMASMSDAFQAIATSGMAWWSPEFWSAVNKRSPSTLQNMAEPAFGSFVGLDQFSPLLVWEHILPDLTSPAGWSPANVFNPSNWFDTYSKDQPTTWFGMPMPENAMAAVFNPEGRSKPAYNLMSQWAEMLQGARLTPFIPEMQLPFMAPVANPWLASIVPGGVQTASTMFAVPNANMSPMLGVGTSNPFAAWTEAYETWNRMAKGFAPGPAATPQVDLSSPAMWMNNAFPFGGSDSIKVFVASISVPSDHLKKLQNMFTTA